MSVLLADSLIDIFYGDFRESTLLEPHRASDRVCGGMHAREEEEAVESPERLFTNQVGFAALIRSQAGAELSHQPPPVSLLSIAFEGRDANTHTHTHITAFRLSFGLLLLGLLYFFFFRQNLFRNFPHCRLFM